MSFPHKPHILQSLHLLLSSKLEVFWLLFLIFIFFTTRPSPFIPSEIHQVCIFPLSLLCSSIWLSCMTLFPRSYFSDNLLVSQVSLFFFFFFLNNFLSVWGYIFYLAAHAYGEQIVYFPEYLFVVFTYPSATAQILLPLGRFKRNSRLCFPWHLIIKWSNHCSHVKGMQRPASCFLVTGENWMN